MQFLVTGGAGFIGQHLVRQLVLAHGQRSVVVLDACTRAATGWQAVQALLGASLVQGQVQQHRLVTELFTQVMPDVVVHLAAQSHVDVSLEKPVGTWKANAVGTAVVAQVCAELGLPLLYCSTDEVYGSTPLGSHCKPVAVGEGAALEPSSPYSASKLAGELAVKAAGISHGLRWAITRGNNAWGQHQLGEKLVPLACGLLQRGEAVPLHGGGYALRQWVHVAEFADALHRVALYLAEGRGTGCTYNISGPTLCSVKELVRALAQAQGLDPDLHTYDSSDRPGQDSRYYTSGASLELDLGWKAQRDILQPSELQGLLQHYRQTNVQPQVASYACG